MKRLNIFLVLSIFLISFTLAESSGGELTGKSGECIELPQECPDCTYFKITTIKYPNMSLRYVNELMTKQGTSYNYTFCDTNEIGEYVYCMVGDVTGEDTSVCNNFEITATGSGLTNQKSILYTVVMIISILIFLGLLYCGIMINGKNQTNLLSFMDSDENKIPQGGI